MKIFTKSLFSLMLCIAALTGSTKATVVNVEVEDFEFNPATFIVNVGDTIHWFWEEGFHTTTSFIIPTGAPSWNQPISSASPTFDYVVTVPGSYDYICSPHASMGMTGHFTALGPTGIAENTNPSLNLLNSYVSNGELNFDYASPGFSQLSFYLYDIVGHRVNSGSVANQPAGIHSHSIQVGSLPKGIYILSLVARNAQLTRRIIIE